MGGQSSSPVVSADVLNARLDRVRAAMRQQGADVLLLSLGADLPYLTGYTAMPLERLTMLVLPVDGEATLVVPGLEAARVVEQPGVFTMRPWGELEDPCSIVADLAGPATQVLIGDRTWAQFLVELQLRMPRTTFGRASTVVSSIRGRKGAAEIEALRRAGAAADRVATQLQSGQIPLVGRTEAEVSADISARLIAEGHDIVNFAIVAAGENAASCHHEPTTTRVIRANEVVLCDFGGTMAGYCSDITRVVSVAPAAEVLEAYAVLFEARAVGVAAATVGASCESIDASTRDVIEAAGYGEYFIHRTGHGIGMEAHEDPYIVAGNTAPLEPGHAFSVEPGIYVPGRFGLRLEDIVVATDAGPEALNRVDHQLVILG